MNFTAERVHRPTYFYGRVAGLLRGGLGHHPVAPAHRATTSSRTCWSGRRPTSSELLAAQPADRRRAPPLPHRQLLPPDPGRGPDPRLPGRAGEPALGGADRHLGEVTKDFSAETTDVNGDNPVPANIFTFKLSRGHHRLHPAAAPRGARPVAPGREDLPADAEQPDHPAQALLPRGARPRCAGSGSTRSSRRTSGARTPSSARHARRWPGPGGAPAAAWRSPAEARCRPRVAPSSSWRRPSCGSRWSATSSWGCSSRRATSGTRASAWKAVRSAAGGRTRGTVRHPGGPAGAGRGLQSGPGRAAQRADLRGAIQRRLF